jgi:TfoX/Sxy family transcriptional regulator of competence genes
MASDIGFVQFIVDQTGNTGEVTFRKMFGEYAVYHHRKVVALICDNQLFIKPTESGRSFIGDVLEAPPYPGAKNYFLIEDRIDDREWLRELIRITSAELPEPKKVQSPAGEKPLRNGRTKRKTKTGKKAG